MLHVLTFLALLVLHFGRTSVAVAVKASELVSTGIGEYWEGEKVVRPQDSKAFILSRISVLCWRD